MIFNKLFQASCYLNYLLKAKSNESLESGYISELYQHAIIKNEPPEGFEQVEHIRSELLAKNAWIDVHDLGAGKNKPTLRRLRDIAKKSASNKRKSILLSNLISYTKPENVFELGTSFGISTMYMALSLPHSNVYTVEGCSQTLSIANNNFQRLNLSNIKPSNAIFEAELPRLLKTHGKADFIFFDGNHTKQATLKYFKMALPYVHDKTVFVFDDICHSYEMSKAWDIIIDNEKVHSSVNLFQVGLVLFDKNLTKKNYILKL